MSNPTVEYIHIVKKESFEKVARWDCAVILNSFSYIPFTSQKKLKLISLSTPASGYSLFCTDYRVPLEQNNVFFVILPGAFSLPSLLPGACSNSHFFYSSFKFISSTKKKITQTNPFWYNEKK